MKIALIVDNPYRDLPGLVLLAMRLCQEDVICHLVPMNLRDKELWTLAPDFVLLHQLRTVTQEFARELLKAGIKIGVLDTEGGVLASLDAYAKTMAPDQAVRHSVSCFCSWGPKLAEHAICEGWYQDEQIVVTGTPRFDFYGVTWREAALQASPYADAYPKPMVLINSNFPLINPRFKTPDEEAEMLVEHFGYDREYVLNWQSVQRQTMFGMVELANHLAARFQQLTIIYRPHPFERLETYYDLLEARDNLHLVKTGTVDGWILRASAVIQRSCSTAIEAGIAGVPALSPVWIPTPAIMSTAEDVSVPCETEEELTQILGSILTGNYERPTHIQHRLDEVISEWFYKVDSLAHERVADCILRSLPADGSRLRLHRCRNVAYGLGRSGASLKSKARATLLKTLGLTVHWSFRQWRPVLDDLAWWDKSEKYFDVHQVKILVDAVQTCAQAGSKVPLRKIRVQSAQERGDYHFGYLQGRSVMVFPEEISV
jgi:surface carbohydrate biosynthesis protein